MRDRKATTFKKVAYDIGRYLASLCFLYLIFIRLQLSWEVTFFILVAVLLRLNRIEVPLSGGDAYRWFLWSLLFSSNLANAAVAFFLSFFFQKDFELKKWRYHFDQFINVLLCFFLPGFLYFYSLNFASSFLLRFLLFILFSQLFGVLWFFLESLGKELVYRPLHSVKTLAYRLLGGAILTSIFALTTYLVGVGGALASLLLLYLSSSLSSKLKEKEGIFDRNLNLISAIEEKLLHQPDQTKRVIKEVLSLGKSLGLPQNELESLKKAALFHNIGMLKVAPFVNRQGPLEEKEYEILKEHPKVLENFCQFKPWLSSVLHHHEHFDGTGYPQGIIGESIPFPARVLALAQAFVALTSPRPYRKALFEDEALDELKRGEGTKYDAVLLRAYLRLKKGKGSVEEKF